MLPGKGKESALKRDYHKSAYARITVDRFMGRARYAKMHFTADHSETRSHDKRLSNTQDFYSSCILFCHSCKCEIPNLDDLHVMR